MAIRTVEIGGTNIRIKDLDILDGGGITTISEISGLPLSSDPKEFVERIVSTANEQIKGIAYVVAGPVTDHQVIQKLPNRPEWPKNVNLAELTQEICGLPSLVFNDMEAAVTGMAYLFKHQGKQDPFWGITWSSGIGGRYWDGTKVVSDAEIGHITLDPSPLAPLCGCGKRGHAEAIIGGKAIERRVKVEMEVKGQEIDEAENPCHLLDELFKIGNDWARELYCSIAQLMGIFIAGLVQTNHCSLICFKGSFAQRALSLPGIADIILLEVSERVISEDWEVEKIIFSPDPENDGLIGSVILFHQLLG